MPVMAMMGTPFSPEQLDEIRALSNQYGFTLREMDASVRYPADALEDCDILLGYFPRGLLKGAHHLRWLHLPSAGADKYADDGLYDGHDFTLTNSSGAFGAAIAEQLVMGVLMLLRRMPEYLHQQQQHVWHRVGNLRFLGGSRVAILGTGNLGSTFAGYCTAMGAETVGISRSGRPVEHFSRVYPMSRRLEAVQNADVVAACLPLTKETQGILDQAFFRAMKPGAIFLNTGRGKTVCQDDLIEALRSGHLGGAMLDVAEVEPMPPDCPLWEMENVFITPHISGSDLDPQNTRQIFEIFRENFARYVQGQPLQNVVNRTKGY